MGAVIFWLASWRAALDIYRLRQNPFLYVFPFGSLAMGVFVAVLAVML